MKIVGLTTASLDCGRVSERQRDASRQARTPAAPDGAASFARSGGGRFHPVDRSGVRVFEVFAMPSPGGALRKCRQAREVVFRCFGEPRSVVSLPIGPQPLCTGVGGCSQILGRGVARPRKLFKLNDGRVRPTALQASISGIPVRVCTSFAR